MMFDVELDDDAQEAAFEQQKKELKRKLENMKLLQSHTTKNDKRTFLRDRLFAANAVVSIVSLVILFELNWEKWAHPAPPHATP